MKEEKKLVPKRRFREFIGIWETENIKNCIYYIKGFAFKSSIYQKEGIRIIRASDLGTNEIMDNNEKIFIDRDFQGKYQPYKLNLGDIIITTVGSKAELKESAVGRPILVKRDNQGLLNQNLVKLSPVNGYDSYFIYGNLLKKRYVDYVRSIERGNANQANITINDLLEYKIIYGSSIEQQKIGEFFKILDERITNQERKIAKVKALKSAYLTEMFPQEGETIPKRRFKGFEGEWTENKIEKLAVFSKGKGYSKKDLRKSGHPLILYGRLYTNYETIINNIDTYAVKQDNSVLSKGGEVVVPSSGESKEDIARASVISKPNIIIGGDLNVINPSSELEPVFLALNISNGTLRKELIRRAQGSSVVHIYNEDLMHVTLLYPNIKEQQKIGAFFKNLDDKITIEEKKLEKLKKMKEAYLEEMFV